MRTESWDQEERVLGSAGGSYCPKIRRKESWERALELDGRSRIGSGGENLGIRRRESWDQEESTGIRRRMSCELEESYRTGRDQEKGSRDQA